MSTHRDDDRRLRRSYDRNLGYAKFWGGATLGVLAAIFAFLSQPQTSAGYGQSAVFLEVLRAILGLAAGSSMAWAAIFWMLYRSDDRELTRIEQRNQEEAT